eukprot:GILI01029971.1.p1 GENE.GILI01029971.1~~GILI01029971.1.p1  ORF type:complete len:348 (-),score=32.17 GILI01029971.1:51-1070(-)
MRTLILIGLVVALPALSVAQVCGSPCPGIQSCMVFTDACRCPAAENSGANCDVPAPASCKDGLVSAGGVCYSLTSKQCWGEGFAKCCPSINNLPCSGGGICYNWGTASPVCRCLYKATGTVCRPMSLTHQLADTISKSKSLSHTVTMTLTGTISVSTTSSRSRRTPTRSKSRNTHTLRLTNTLTKTKSPSHTVTYTISPSRSRFSPSASKSRKSMPWTATKSIWLLECYYSIDSALRTSTIAQLAATTNKADSALASRMQRYLASSVVTGAAFSMPNATFAGGLLSLIFLSIFTSAKPISNSVEEAPTSVTSRPKKSKKPRSSKLPPTAGPAGRLTYQG